MVSPGVVGVASGQKIEEKTLNKHLCMAKRGIVCTATHSRGKNH